MVPLALACAARHPVLSSAVFGLMRTYIMGVLAFLVLATLVGVKELA